MAVYDPALMLQPGPDGTISFLGVVYITFKALVAIALWGAAAIGHLRGPLNWFARVVAFVAAALLVATIPLTDEAGFALGTALLAWHAWRTRKGAFASGA
jgi:TRAP-type uncharacterized transport system fused permease subunit